MSKGFRLSDKELNTLLKQGQHSILYSNSLSLNLNPDVRNETNQRRGKYNAIRKEVDGITFDSSGEAARYSALKWQTELGLIQHDDKWLQVPFTLLPADGKQRAITYRVDFVYRCGDVLVAEDFKGFETATFKIKAKLFRSQYSEYDLWINKDKGAVYGSKAG